MENRFKISTKISTILSENFKELRFGQFLSNFESYLNHCGKDIFYINDEEFLDYLNSFVEFHKNFKA